MAVFASETVISQALGDDRGGADSASLLSVALYKTGSFWDFHLRRSMTDLEHKAVAYVSRNEKHFWAKRGHIVTGAF